eukprot:Gb_06290 [translate_table: standard]
MMSYGRRHEEYRIRAFKCKRCCWFALVALTVIIVLLGAIPRPQQKMRLLLQNTILNDKKGMEALRMVIRSPSAYWMNQMPSGIVEVKIAAVAFALRVRVKVANMLAFLQDQAFRYARQTLDAMVKLSYRRVARSKQEFDIYNGPAWDCIMGTSFGSFVTHSLGCFLYFSVDKDARDRATIRGKD